MFIETYARDFFVARQTNASDNGFPSRLATATAPSGTGNSAAQATASAVRQFNESSGGSVPNSLLLLPFGTGADANTFSLRVIGWSNLVGPPVDQVNAPTLWVPVVLCELLATLSSTNTGAAGTALGTSQFFAKTISVTTGNSNVSVEVVSAATAGIYAYAILDLRGFKRVEFTFTTGGSATDCNLLAKPL